jgi:hypothetical protein
MASETNITSSVYVGVVVTILSMALWLLLRRRYPFLFMTRAFMRAEWAPEEKPGYFEWIPYTINYTEKQLLQSPGGTDAVVSFVLI